VNRSNRTWTDHEAIGEITGGCVGDRDQKIGMVEGPRQVTFESFEGDWRDRVRHRDESEVMDRRHLCPSEGHLIAVEKEVGCKEYVVAIQDSHERFDDGSQDEEGGPDGQQETGRYLVDAQSHGAVSGHLRRWSVVRGEEGAGIEVVGDSVVSPVEGCEQIPLVPSDAGHALEKRVDIDPDCGCGVIVDDSGMEAAPTGAQSAYRIAGDIAKEPECSREAPEHGGRFYRR
jgi:hypothetical protein